jgi:flagellar hook-associated protein 2
MSVVGLSFGSPTSGTGFDVSSTVSSIVANLQSVETPWKSQLTKLESQDTAISSLGTLFSTLSNDVSSLTDFQGIIAQKEGSSSDQNVLTLTAANSTAIAGTHTVTVKNLATTSSGYLAEIPNSSDTLSGSITLQVGNGAAQTVSVPSTSGENTLTGLASAINASAVGITASVLTDASGSRLSLVSGTSGAGGNINVTNSKIVDTTVHLNSTVTPGSDAVVSTGTPQVTSTALLTGIATQSDTLSGSISIQVGSGAAQTVTVGKSSNTLSTLATAINNTTGLGVSAVVVQNSDSSYSLQLTSATDGLAGTLTVSSSIVDASTAASTPLGYTSPVSGANANLTVDGVALTSASNTVANLIPGVTFQLLAPSPTESDSSLEPVQVVIANDNAGVESTVNQFVSDYNALISATNAQEGLDSSGKAEPLFGSPTLSLLQQQLLNGLNKSSPNGYLTPVTNGLNTTLAGSLTIQIGTGIAESFTPSSPNNTLAGLASAVNAANMGVTATVVTNKDGTSDLSILSENAASSVGALSVTSSIVATSDTALSASVTQGVDAAAATSTSAVTSSAALSTIAGENDILSGSISIQVGNGTAETVTVGTSSNTLSSLATAINNTPNIGVTAAVVNTNGTYSLQLTSGTAGSAGTLTVTSSILDTTNTTQTPLDYTNSSDINNLTSLGISVNNDGSMTLDATSLDSLLNSDYSGVVGFFQNENSWGQSFSTMLTNSGTSAGTGVLALASKSNSNIESTLNADISKEDLLISAQQKSLTCGTEQRQRDHAGAAYATARRQ